MKRAAIIAAALAMVLSLAACGNRDNGSQTPNGSNNGSSTVENGTTGGSITGGNGGSSAGNSSGTMNNGTGSGDTNGSLTGPDSSLGTDTDVQGRSSVGRDLRRAADNVGDAARDLVDDGRNALSRAASATTFERMLDNARVHDTDGVLTDGENSRW